MWRKAFEKRGDSVWENKEKEIELETDHKQFIGKKVLYTSIYWVKDYVIPIFDIEDNFIRKNSENWKIHNPISKYFVNEFPVLNWKEFILICLHSRFCVRRK